MKTCYKKLVDIYKNSANNTYIVFNNHKIKMSLLLKEIDTFATALNKMGWKRGDVLTVYLPTCPQAFVAFYACSKIGVVANIVHPLLPFEQLKKNLEITRSKGIMYYDILVKNQEQLGKTGQILIKCSVSDYVSPLTKIFYMIYAAAKSKFYKSARLYKLQLLRYAREKDENEEVGRPDDAVITMHSGGTGGEPKIVALSNDALNELSDNLYKMYVDINPVGGGEYAVVALPIFHAYGLGVAVHTCICNHYNLIFMPKFNARQVNKYIKKYNVTFMAGVPIMFKKMMEENNFEGKHLKKLKDLWCGGDVLNENLVEHFNEKLKKYGSNARLMRGYGLTEVASVCTTNNLKNYRKKSCGKALPGTTVEIWSDVDGEKLSPNQIGEIVVSTPSIMMAYEDGTGIINYNGKKWVRSGDLGYLDKDGFLYVIERKKRTIKIAAVNVFPSEIEEVATQNKFVKEACAVPYHYNDKTYIRLYITVEENLTLKDKENIEKDVKELIKKKLIKYATPHDVVIIDEMPLTKLGKIDYKKLEIL